PAMKISTSWLREYVAHDLDPEALARALTFQACPVEGIARLGGDDACIELEVTFNRGDMLSHMGVAREVAVATGAPVREPDPAPPQDAGCPAARCASVAVEEPELCPRYTARVIRGVRVGASPAWL